MYLVTQSCLILCVPKDCSPPGSSVHGILQARMLEWVAILLQGFLLQRTFPTQGSNPGLLHCKQVLYYLSHQENPVLWWFELFCTFTALITKFWLKVYTGYALVNESCLTLCNPMDCSPSGSSVHGIFQARILEWVAIFFYRGSSQSRAQTCISCTGRRILYHCSMWEALFIQDRFLYYLRIKPLIQSSSHSIQW